jgi:MFS transporter, ACS family, hexuronate transporter
MSFVLIGALGFVWMGFWTYMYKKPHVHPSINKAELVYITQDKTAETKANNNVEIVERQISFAECFQYKQTWAFVFGKFMTDGVWWFYLFWTPAYLSDVYGLTSDTATAQILLFVLYAITLLSIIGGWLPSYFVNKKGMDPYAGRMRSMLIFAFFPLLALLAQPLGSYSYWFPVIIIGIAGAAHQAWSANIFSTVGDMFPKTAVATITGIGGMAGGVGSFLINKGSGVLFDFSATNNWKILGFEGIKSGYFVIFSICAVAYLIGWIVMKVLVPKYQPIVLESHRVITPRVVPV